MCDRSLKEHISEILAAFELSQIGGACETTYHALVEIVAAMQAMHQHPPYEPQGLLAMMEDPTTTH